MRRIVTDQVAWSVGLSVGLSLWWACKNGWTDQDAVWLVGLVGSKIHVLDGVQIPVERVILIRERRSVVKHKDTLPWAVQKRLHRSRCLGFGLGWTQGTKC